MGKVLSLLYYLHFKIASNSLSSHLFLRINTIIKMLL